MADDISSPSMSRPSNEGVQIRCSSHSVKSEKTTVSRHGTKLVEELAATDGLTIIGELMTCATPINEAYPPNASKYHP